MSPDGLIFLVIFAIWAAYFIQYWIRRREHLSTARSMDRFSESMRVLSRRSPLPETSLGSPATRTYAVSPARAARPQVLVKRAAVTTPSAADPRDPVGVEPVASGTSPSEAPSTRRHDAPRSAPAARDPRAACGVALLVALAGLLVTTLLALLSVLLWWAPAIPLAVAVVAVAGLRTLAVAGRRHRRAVRSGSRAVAGPGRRPSAEPAPAATTAPEPAVEAAVEVEVEVEAAEAEAPYDIDPPVAAPTAPQRSVVPLVDEDDIPLTWDPVPVPRPTYTMKARAKHPEPAPADVTPTPQRAQAEPDAAYEEPRRRVVGG